MTISDGTHVTGAQPRHAVLQRRAPRPLVLATEPPARTDPEMPDRAPIGPAAATKTEARSHQPLLATMPQPRNTSRPNPLSP